MKKGFTLIELLVVVGIIGLLASIVIVSVAPTRVKARDSKRIADVRAMALALEQEAIAESKAVGVCTAAYAKANTCSGPGSVDFATAADPVAKTSGTACTGGASPSTSTCQYSISLDSGAAAAKTDDYQICFYLEGDMPSAGLSKGLNQISDGGIFGTGCQ